MNGWQQQISLALKWFRSHGITSFTTEKGRYLYVMVSEECIQVSNTEIRERAEMQRYRDLLPPDRHVCSNTIKHFEP